MSAIPLNLQSLLRAAAAVQLAVAVLNLGLVRLLKWEDSLEQLPLLLRQVFMVHLWFISLTVAIFGVMTWRFGAIMAAGSDPACAWLSGAIGLFWGLRAVIQIAYYSPSHWRGHTGRTIVNIGCLVVYGGMSFVYLLATARSWQAL
jgi:hypothetical protein